MANTTFSGPTRSTNGFVHRTDTTANLSDATAAVNVTGKQAGLVVIDTTSNKVYWATGSAATDPWYAFDKGATAGGADITPS